MKATIKVDQNRAIGQVDPKIYGQFLSRRRGVADGGLYAPAHPDADDAGLRRQVVDAIAASGPPIVRWPGGCTGTSYDWKDGVGPKKERERTIDTHFGYDVDNGFGTAEFVAFCRQIGAEPQLNLNTGLGTLNEALQWIEYTNFATPSRWANLRRSHGYEDGFGVKYWQIGNEDYGPWEIGHQSPGEYAILAREWAKTIKKLDPSLQVLAVGGSQQGSSWDYTLLHEAWPHIDYLTAHRYWNFDSSRGIDNYDAIAGVGYLEEQTTRAIGELIELVARDLKQTRRPRLAFTEWNCRDQRQREMTPQWRPSDTQYRLVDALAVAGFLNMMQRQSRHVGLATFAQSINVVGMLLVTEEEIVRESVYWPLLMQRHHSGETAVDTWVDCEGYGAEFEGRWVEGIPYLDASATVDTASNRLYLSMVNSHRTDELVTQIQTGEAIPATSGQLHRLWHSDPLARNTIAAPDAIIPSEATIDVSGSSFELQLPPHSYTILELDI
jgi:alpha-N-arabinofuranosidase